MANPFLEKFERLAGVPGDVCSCANVNCPSTPYIRSHLSQFRNVEPQNPEKYIYIYITFISIEFYNI